MTRLESVLAPQKYPLRYWIAIVCAIGMPNFIKFDSTGLTHSEGLFNVTSIGSIFLTLTTAFVFAVITLLSQKPILQRRVTVSAGLWISLLVLLTIASILQPAPHMSRLKATDLPLSLYRLGEWVLAFLLFLSIYTRESEERATDLIIRLISVLCWVKIILVWLMLPIMPSLVYGVADDTAEAHRRLGGSMVHPVHLSVLAGVAFFHAFFFLRGPRKAVACFFALATLALTYARSEQLVFLIVLMVYILAITRNPLHRWAGIIGMVSVGVGALVFQDKILTYLARGQGVRNITTLSERTLVWQASFRAFWLRPYIGYGYIAGVKNALRDQWIYTNWLPPHSHSEFIQALVSGGFLAGILVVCLYIRVLWGAIVNASQGLKHIFLLIALIQLTLMAFIMPLITVQFGDTGCLFLMCFIGIVAAKKKPVAQKAAQPVSSHSMPHWQWAEEAASRP
jgi:O-antigen ligase